MENQRHADKEQKTLYRKKAEHKVEKKKLFDAGMKKAGKILIISDMDVEKREIFLLRKKQTRSG